MSQFEAPIPLSEIESVLAWVDGFKLSRQTKKINRDFSDAVLLAEILSVYYPKLVEMHNYPPRNSHSLKLNNWMTLNRKVLKKLKLTLCCNTMEQLANSAPGVIERVLVMARDKIRRDEEANRASKEEGTNMSSGGSYYEACGDEENILVVPVKTRVNGVLETVQQKVVSYESYLALKEELKDANDVADVLKQKVEHLDNLMKIKDERIDELQNQLERKQARRKEVEALQNSLSVPFEPVASPQVVNEFIIPPNKIPSVQTLKSVDSKTKVDEPKITTAESRTRMEEIKPRADESRTKIVDSKTSLDGSKTRVVDSKTRVEDSRIPVAKESFKSLPRPSLTEINKDTIAIKLDVDVEKIKSDIFKEIEIVENRSESVPDFEDFKDSEQEVLTTIEETIQNEIKDIIKPNSLENINFSMNIL
ncbi:sperm flagellar protein 1-like [Anticarsia gemmatalis]|uniref:sperm flagellar protein 1-like n=1 Tax=Anticarsia gemmatalis TaxID=129554 RepID=UPI003F7745CD